MIKATLRELVDNNPILNNDEFVLENALTGAFNQLVCLSFTCIYLFYIKNAMYQCISVLLNHMIIHKLLDLTLYMK